MAWMCQTGKNRTERESHTMSHFTALVIVLDVGSREQAEKAVERLLAPYSEGLEVEPYTNDDGEETTYNPRSKLDWYEIGGRWDGAYGEGNFIKLQDLPDIEPPFALVLPDGSWHERGRMGWWAMVDNEKPRDEWGREFQQHLAPYRDTRQGAIGVLVDCHI
jgi:hypothetical protein